MECQICATELNASVRARVPCFACPLVVCKTCVREYLKTSTALPKCMGCGAAFQLNYLVTHLNRSWVNDGLKPVMKETLVAAELAKMPATLPFAEAELERRRLAKMNRDYQARIDKLQAQMTRYTNAMVANRYRMRGEAVPARYLNDLVRDDNGGAAVREDTKKKFIMACPNGGCKGFLSTAYKCALCEKFTCPDCLVVLGDDHACVESDKLSAELIKKETRPCPTCGERIFKVNGCDQMFCTAVNDGTRCATVFDWKTGAVQVGGVVHNPHFYELGRANGELARNVGDMPCGGLPDIRRLIAVLERLDAQQTRHRVFVTYQRLAEHGTMVLDPLRGRLRRMGDTRALRVQYLLKDITLDELRDRVFKENRDHGKTVDLYHISELVNVSGIEAYLEICRGLPSLSTLAQLMDASPTVGRELVAGVDARLNDLDRIRLYCNEQLKQISITYACTVQVFTSDFSRQSRKFNIKA
jgi:hypothetical protein